MRVYIASGSGLRFGGCCFSNTVRPLPSKEPRIDAELCKLPFERRNVDYRWRCRFRRRLRPDRAESPERLNELQQNKNEQMNLRWAEQTGACPTQINRAPRGASTLRLP